MIDDRDNKGHTNFNMFSVFGEQIRSLSSKQSKLNCWNQLHHKNCICMLFLDTNSHLTTIPYNFDIKCQSNSESYDQHGFFWDQVYGGLEYFINGRRFFQRERVLWGWLAGPYHTSMVNNWFWQTPLNLPLWTNRDRKFKCFSCSKASSICLVYKV